MGIEDEIVAMYGIVSVGIFAAIIVAGAYAEQDGKAQAKLPQQTKEFKCQVPPTSAAALNIEVPSIPAIHMQFLRAKLVVTGSVPENAWDHLALPLPEYRLQDANSEWAINGVYLAPEAPQEANAPHPEP